MGCSPRNRGSIPGSGVHTDTGAHSVPYSVGIIGSPTKIEQPGHEADHLPFSSGTQQRGSEWREHRGRRRARGGKMKIINEETFYVRNKFQSIESNKHKFNKCDS